MRLLQINKATYTNTFIDVMLLTLAFQKYNLKTANEESHKQHCFLLLWIKIQTETKGFIALYDNKRCYNITPSPFLPPPNLIVVYDYCIFVQHDIL